MIGKSKNPRCFKNINRDQLPVIYANQKNAWVNTSLFGEWFHNSFVPIVQKKLVEIGVDPKGVLLLDNCSAHPDESELLSKDGKIIAKFLPPNVTALIQPMDQGILVSIKRRYRRKILEELVFQDDQGMSIVAFLKKIDMLKVAKIIASSWEEISPISIQLSWRKILPDSTGSSADRDDDVSNVEVDSSSEVEGDAAIAEECAFILQELGFELGNDEIEDWLETDRTDYGYAHLTDDEIITSIVERPIQEETQDAEDSDEVSPTISHSAAVKMFDGCMQWLQEQGESNIHNMAMLTELRDLAARKRISTLKQKKITDYTS